MRCSDGPAVVGVVEQVGSDDSGPCSVLPWLEGPWAAYDVHDDVGNGRLLVRVVPLDQVVDHERCDVDVDGTSRAQHFTRFSAGDDHPGLSEEIVNHRTVHVPGAPIGALTQQVLHPVDAPVIQDIPKMTSVAFGKPRRLPS